MKALFWHIDCPTQPQILITKRSHVGHDGNHCLQNHRLNNINCVDIAVSSSTKYLKQVMNIKNKNNS